MRQLLLLLCLTLMSPLAQAWNAAGHRLSALIAWQELSPDTQQWISSALARHPDYPSWQEKARSNAPLDVFAEAAIWPDTIRNDARFYDERRDPPTPALPGLSDTARHKTWHYVDLADDGQVRQGGVDRQIERLSQLLRSTAKSAQITYALPWLLHLVGDIHQPLHVGRHGDAGGNEVQIENPFNQRQPFSSLHRFWDDLPGPPGLRGKKLASVASWLRENYPAPVQGNVALWRSESYRLHAEVYPATAGSLLPIVTEDFQHRAREIANQRIVDAGYRLGGLLEEIYARRVSRETP
jgi:hypothetical protein